MIRQLNLLKPECFQALPQIFSNMKITKFLNIDIEPAPPEMELQVEMQCREIMQANDIDNIKRYCTQMVRKKFDQDIFMASLLN